MTVSGCHTAPTGGETIQQDTIRTVDTRDDTETRNLLARAANTILDAESFSVEMRITGEVQVDGRLAQGMSRRNILHGKAPSRFALLPSEEQPENRGDVFVVTDEEDFFVLSADQRRWHRTNAPDGIEAFLNVMKESRHESAQSYTNVAQALLGLLWSQNDSRITSVTYLGMGTMRGEPVHRIAYRVQERLMKANQLVILRAQPPILPLRVTLVDQLQRVFVEHAETERSMARQFTIDFTWDLNPHIDDSLFAFVPPKGSREVSPLHVYMEPMTMEVEAVDLVGLPIEDIELSLIDGSRFSLCDADAGEVILLDFWATWCLPCIRAMPILQRVADEYGDRGVVLYAINVGEDSSTIKQFLERHDWHVTVAMDEDNSLSDQLGIAALPTTLIVDQDRIVRAVHIGAGEGYELILRKEIDSLLATVE